MNLLLIVDDYLLHSIKVAAKMMHELALEFKMQGHSISVLTPVPTQKQKLVIKEIDEIEIIYFRSKKIKNISKFKRAVNETLLSFYAWHAAKNILAQRHFDGIVYYSPSIFWGHLVKILQRKWKCKSYLILRDIFPQWTVDNGLMKQGSIIHIYFTFFEKINYNIAHKIGVMSPSNLNYFKSTNHDLSKFEVLYNWAKVPQIPQHQNKYRNELKLENKLVFFYGGNIGYAQQIMNLVQLAIQLKDNTNVHFLFVGIGDEVELIKKEKAKNNLSNLTYLPSVNQEIYFEMLNEFDIGMFSLHPDHQTHNFPGKLLGYMGYSKPIIGCVNRGNDLKEIVNNAQAGIITDSGDNQGLLAAAKSLIKSEEIRIEMGKAGRKLLATQFSIKNTASQIEQALK